MRANQIDCIIVKDFSRFGRNSIETGYFIERVFPLFHTRFISISDDFDSSKFKGDTGGMDVAFKYGGCASGVHPTLSDRVRNRGISACRVRSWSGVSPPQSAPSIRVVGLAA